MSDCSPALVASVQFSERGRRDHTSLSLRYNLEVEYITSAHSSCLNEKKKITCMAISSSIGDLVIWFLAMYPDTISIFRAGEKSSWEPIGSFATPSLLQFYSIHPLVGFYCPMPRLILETYSWIYCLLTINSSFFFLQRVTFFAC